MNYLKRTFVLVCILVSYSSFAQNRQPFVETIGLKNKWVDATFKKMSRRERIAQLFMVRAHTNKGKAFEDSIAMVIQKQRIGGLVFFQGGPGRQAALINRYQSISKTPLLIAMDGEWGLGMRLDSTLSYPYQMTLGAIQNNQLIYEMGKQIASDFKRLGMHVNFAPDVDINNNPKNPVIGFRSFGDNKYNVATKAGAYMKGLQDKGVLVSLKHFPGHGDTDVDSHLDLPQLLFDRKRLDSLELYPFRELIKQGASGIMTAHINIPAMDTTAHLPASLSHPIITGVLKNELGFKGLVFSDAMEMKGVLKFFHDGEADVRAIIAGNDLVELSENTERAIKLVRKAIRQGRISWDQINQSVKKVLAAKYWVGLDTLKAVAMESVVEDLNGSDAWMLNQRLADAAVTVLKSDRMIKGLDFKKNTAIISLGVTSSSTFQAMLKPKFGNVETFILPKDASPADIADLKSQLNGFKQIIVSIHDMRRRPWSKLDYSSDLKLFIADLAKMNSMLCVFASAYALDALPGIEQCRTILMNYQRSDELQNASVRVILGQLKASGKLPVTVNPFFKYGDGM
jgi:beta-glucosidase-like glycosyl hydrolase